MGVDASHHDTLKEKGPYEQADLTAKTRVPRRRPVKPQLQKRDPDKALDHKPDKLFERRKDGSPGKTKTLQERLAENPKKAEAEVRERIQAVLRGESFDKENPLTEPTQPVSKAIDIPGSKSRHRKEPCEMSMSADASVSKSKSMHLEREDSKMSTQSCPSRRFDEEDEYSRMSFKESTPDEVKEDADATCSPKVARDRQRKYIGKFKAKASVEKSNCAITGIAIVSKTAIVVADNKNHSVKLISKTGQMLSRLRMISGPWDIAVLPDDQIAVTLPKKKCIQIISTAGSDLTKVQNIELNAECYGIGFRNGKLFVLCSTKPVSLIVLSLEGELLHCIRSDSHGHQLFQTADHLTVTSDAVFVSDRETSEITKLSHDGEVIKTFEDKVISYPSCLTTTGEEVLVCSWLSNNIFGMTRNFSMEGMVLKEDEGCLWPQSVCYSKNSRVLYVGSHDLCSEGHEHVNYIRMYKLGF